MLCTCVSTCLLQCVAGHQGQNPENEGLPGKADGVSGRRPGGARSSSSQGIRCKQEEGVCV